MPRYTIVIIYAYIFKWLKETKIVVYKKKVVTVTLYLKNIKCS